MKHGCPKCGSPNHIGSFCPGRAVLDEINASILGDDGATFERLSGEPPERSSDAAAASRRAASFGFAPPKRAVACGVLRIQADYRDGGNANIIEGSARGDAGVVVLSGRCECEVFKADGILCPPSLEESLALEGISVDGADRLRSLYVSNPPPLWALRKASLDVPVAQLGSLFEVRLRLLKPCVPDIALTGRILR